MLKVALSCSLPVTQEIVNHVSLTLSGRLRFCNGPGVVTPTGKGNADQPAAVTCAANRGSRRRRCSARRGATKQIVSRTANVATANAVTCSAMDRTRLRINCQCGNRLVRVLQAHSLAPGSCGSVCHQTGGRSLHEGAG